MRDITAPESFRWRRFVDVFEHTVGLAGYDLVIPPLLEDIGVFTRLGEATDVVTKEMYDFVDKGERHVALRPEQTASICRSFVEHRPTTPFKAWYAGPNFRYENHSEADTASLIKSVLRSSDHLIPTLISKSSNWVGRFLLR